MTEYKHTKNDVKTQHTSNVREEHEQLSAWRRRGRRGREHASSKWEVMCNVLQEIGEKGYKCHSLLLAQCPQPGRTRCAHVLHHINVATTQNLSKTEKWEKHSRKRRERGRGCERSGERRGERREFQIQREKAHILPLFPDDNNISANRHPALTNTARQATNQVRCCYYHCCCCYWYLLPPLHHHNQQECWKSECKKKEDIDMAAECDIARNKHNMVFISCWSALFWLFIFPFSLLTSLLAVLTLRQLTTTWFR